MKFKLPDALKADVPATLWGRVLTATPVVMTVVATALAGLASSEMTRAQYARSLAAQRQSKAGDQWGFFQAKRLRGAMQRSTLDVLQATGETNNALPRTLISPEDAGGDVTRQEQANAALLQARLPASGPVSELAPALRAALAAVESSRSEAEIAPLIAALPDAEIENALRAAKDRASDYDAMLKPITDIIERKEAIWRGNASARGLLAARLRYTAARYDAEARLNQTIAYLYELQVRRSNQAADRHHRRSQRFFYGMLASQAAVIMATFALAASKRGLLWGLAAAAGALAVAFAVYVYLFV